MPVDSLRPSLHIRCITCVQHISSKQNKTLKKRFSKSLHHHIWHTVRVKANTSPFPSKCKCNTFFRILVLVVMILGKFFMSNLLTASDIYQKFVAHFCVKATNSHHLHSQTSTHQTQAKTKIYIPEPNGVEPKPLCVYALLAVGINVCIKHTHTQSDDAVYNLQINRCENY